MGKLECEFLRSQENIPRVWWRNIDDIFAIWTHGELSLREFIENINRHHPTIKFPATWSAEQVTFLDTRVYLKDGRIETNLHVNPPDKHQCLRMDSCHPKHCKTAIPYTQALCIRRICSENENFLKQTRGLKSYFMKRRYNEQHLN